MNPNSSRALRPFLQHIRPHLTALPFGNSAWSFVTASTSVTITPQSLLRRYNVSALRLMPNHLPGNEPLENRAPDSSVKVSQANSSSPTRFPDSRPNEEDKEDVQDRSNNSAAPQPFSPASANFNGPGGLTFPEITKSPTFDAALTTVIGLLMVFVAGVGYLAWYKARVLNKIELAFALGYDPALELANNARAPGSDILDEQNLVKRKEQDLVDDIIAGKKAGQYYLIMGPKGTGKGSMVLDAMRAVHADGVAFCEAHEDLEVFRLRLGRALNFEYMEDSQTGLFQRRDPREGGPALDIERALSKLEKVALRMSPKRDRKPLVLCISNIHMFDDNEDSMRLLLQLQQRAEAWASSGLLTLVFTTDDFWPYLILRKNASRMRIVSVSDLTHQDSRRALKLIRDNFLKHPTNAELEKSRKEDATSNPPTGPLIDRILEITGGRLSALNKIGREKNETDMLRAAEHLVEAEKAWLLCRIGMIPDHDDDVMDEQKWSTTSWLLLQAFVKQREDDEAAREAQVASGKSLEDIADLGLPSIPYWRCRQIMTRPDFLEDLDHENIIAIDFKHNVRPDSALVFQAAKQVVEEPGFQETLDSVRARIDEIESLHRTRELTFKDLNEEDILNLNINKNGRMGT